MYDGKMASLMTSLQSTGKTKQVLYWGDISDPLPVEREYELIKKRNTTRLDVNRNEKKDDLLLCRLVRCLTSHCSVQCTHILRTPPPESLNYKTK